MKKVLLIIFVLINLFDLKAASYYWVGGTGNWSDYANHWATSSGGSTFASNAPTLSDDVYFDANSGGGICTLDATANTLTLNFRGSTSSSNYTGTLVGSSALNIYGNLVVSPSMTWSHTGTISFSASTTGKTITSNGISLASAININGTGGGWTLQDALTTTSSFTLTTGTFASGGFNMNIGTNWTNNGGTFTNGSNIVTITGSGTIGGTASTTFYDLIINGSAGIGRNQTVTRNLTINDGAAFSVGVTYTLSVGGTTTLGQGTSGKFTLSSSGACTFTGGVTINNGAIWVQCITPVFSGTPVFTYQSGSALRYVNLGLVAITAGLEWPASSSPPNVTVALGNASSTVTMPGNRTITGTFTNSSLGKLVTGTSSLTLSGNVPVISSTGGVNASSGTIIFANSTPYSLPANFFTSNSCKSLTMNGSGGITLNAPLGLTSSGVLTLTNGIINTTTTNLLTLLRGSNAAISGGSSSSYIDGPLKRYLPMGSGSGCALGLVGGCVYPLGKNGVYMPFTFQEYNYNFTTEQMPIIEAFTASTGGTAPAGYALSTSEYWSITTNGGVGISCLKIKLERPQAIGNNYNIYQSSTLAGSYTSIGTSASTTYSTTSGSTTLPTSTTYYYVLGKTQGSYYWVGGTGNWSDYANHWATSSGGSTFATSAPTIYDDVYFDANSGGGTCTINATAYCNNLNLRGSTSSSDYTGTLAGSSALNIYGNLVVSPSMSWSHTGTTSFSATTTGKTITSNGTSLATSININGTGGGWTLQDALTTTSSFTLTTGTFASGGFNMNIGTNWTNNGGTFTNGSNSVTMTGSGTIGGTATTTFYNLIISGASQSLGRNQIVSNNLTIYDGGGLTVGGTYTLSVGGTTTVGQGTSGIFSLSSSGACTFTGGVNVNSGAIWSQGLTPVFSGTPVFTYQSGSTLRYGNIGLVSITAGLEWPATSSPPNVNVFLGNASSYVSMPGHRTISGTLTISSLGKLLAGSYSLTLSGNVPIISSTGSFDVTSGGRIVFANSTPYSLPSGFFSANSCTNLTMNGSGGVTLNAPLGLTSSGVLTLTNGIITTTSTNLLTLNRTNASAVSGGSSSSYVSGPLARVVPTVASCGGTGLIFPVGKNGNYYPFYLSNYTATASTQIPSVEAFDANTGGTAPAGYAISSTEYWKVITSASTTLSCAMVTLQRPQAIGNNYNIYQSTTLAGSYTSISTSTSSTYSSTSANTSLGVSSTYYYVLGKTQGPFYWVGGTGNWSDYTNHWSTSSGGAPNVTSAPSIYDDVYFDANSGGGSCTINATAYCQNLNLRGSTSSSDYTGTLAGSSALNIYGNLVVSPLMTWSHTGTTSFSATTSGNTITSNGKSLASAININSTGGTYVLNDDFTTTSSFTLTAGQFEMVGFSMNIGTNWSNNGGLLVYGGINYVTMTGSGTIGGSSTTTFPYLIISGASQSLGRSQIVAYNLTINDGGGLSVGGTYTLSVGGTTTVGQGASGIFSLSSSGACTFTGGVTVNSGAIWQQMVTPVFSGTPVFSYQSGSTLRYGNIGLVSITAGLEWPATSSPPNVNVFLGNASSTVTMPGNRTISGTLSNSHIGKLVTGSYTLTLSGNVPIISSTGGVDASSGTIQFANTTAYSLPANFFTSNSCKSLTMNGSGGITLNAPLGLSSSSGSVLALLNGVITTTSTNLLTLNRGSSSGVSGGSSSSYVNGPLKWDVGVGTGSTCTGVVGPRLFPVGKSGSYLPFTFVQYNYNFTTHQIPIVEAFVGNVGGTAPAGYAISNTEYWTVTTNGGVTLNCVNVKLERPEAIGNDYNIYNCSTATGSYTSIGTSASTTYSSTSSTITVPVSSTYYYVLGKTQGPYYWVGGTGNWSDYTNHWATSSGGSTFATSAPTIYDDVYFDANSGGGTCTISAMSYCNNLNLRGSSNASDFTGTLAGGNTLAIYGNLVVSPSMTWTHTGQINFSATTTGKTITSNGKSLACSILILGSGGGWTLQDAFTTTSSFRIDAGTFSSGGYNMSIGTNWSNYGGTFTNGNNTVTMTGSGTIGGTATTTFYDLIISGASQSLGRSQIVTNNLTINDGGGFGLGIAYTLSVGGTTTVGQGTSGVFTLSSVGACTFTGGVTVNNGAIWSQSCTAVYSGTPVFTYQSGSTLRYSIISSVTITAGLEWPATSSPPNVTVQLGNASSTVTMPGNRTITGTFTNSSLGKLVTGSNTLTLSGNVPVISSTGGVDGSSGTIVFENSNPYSLPANFFTSNSCKSLTMNGSGGITLNAPLGLSSSSTSVLTLTNGIITTTSTNLLTLNRNNASAVSGGSSSSYVSGPLARVVPTGSTCTGSAIVFPVGKSGNYYPFTLSDYTATTSSQIPTVEAFAAAAGGTSPVGYAISTTEYWKVITSGVTSLTCAKVKLERPQAIGSDHNVYRSGTLAGSYASIGTSASTTYSSTSANTSLTVSTTWYYTLSRAITSYYWVGGTGNWSDYTNHWATSSGGSSFAYAPPCFLDTVYFDANSGGGTCTIDATAYSNNLNFRGSTSLSDYTGTLAGSSALSIYGNLVASPSMTWSHSGTTTFNSITSGKTITSNGKSLACAINVNGSGGSWTLQDALTTTSSFTLTTGTFATGGNSMNIGTNWNNNGGTFTNGSNTVTMTGTGTLGGSAATTFYDLVISGSQSLGRNQTVSRNLTINDAATFLVGSSYTFSVGGTTTVGGGTSGGFVLSSSGASAFTGGVTVKNGATWQQSVTPVFLGTPAFVYEPGSKLLYSAIGAPTIIAGLEWPATSSPPYVTVSISGAGTVNMPGNREISSVLEIASAGSLNLSTYTLTLSGNSPLKSSTGACNASNGSVVFANSSAISLPSGFYTSNSCKNLTMNGIGGVTLNSALTISNTLTLTDGKIKTNGNILTLGTTSVNASVPNGSSNSYIVAYDNAGTVGKIKQFINSNSTYNFPLGDDSNFTPLTFTLNSNAGLSTADLTIHTKASAIPGVVGTYPTYISRYWEVVNTGITSPNYNIEYNYADGDIVGNEGDLEPIKLSGATWYVTTGSSITPATEQGSGSVNTGSNTLAWTGLSTFSEFGGAGNLPLPIELVSFKVNCDNINKEVNVKWQTASETNNDYFEIETSSNGYDWYVLEQIDGAGNSTKLNNYERNYKNRSEIAYYRLSQTDFNGQKEVFPISSLECQNEIELAMYPNPFNDYFVIESKDITENTKVELYDITSKKVDIHIENSSYQEYTIKTQDLKPGVYVLKILNDDSNKSITIVKTP